VIFPALAVPARAMLGLMWLASNTGGTPAVAYATGPWLWPFASEGSEFVSVVTARTVVAWRCAENSLREVRPDHTLASQSWSLREARGVASGQTRGNGMRRVSGEVRPQRRVGAEGSSRRAAEAVTEARTEKPSPADLEWQRRTAAPALPRVLTTLVPQERELSRTVDRVLYSEAALLTLFGRRGAGTTQPALLAADALVDLFPDGVWFLDLTASREARDVLGALAESLGSTDPPGKTPRVPGGSGQRSTH
jgi:hypothetical protein